MLIMADTFTGVDMLYVPIGNKEGHPQEQDSDTDFLASSIRTYVLRLS